MDSMDDDFGDLYADVEIQASSAIWALYVEPEDNNRSNGAESNDEDEKFDPDSVMEDSDSEDDLNILLNDDDCEKFPVTGVRSHVGGYEEDEDGGFGVEGTGSDKISRRVEPVGDGSELNCSGNGVERGTGAKTHSSLFKYVRPHGSSFPSNARVTGCNGVSSFSSILARNDQEDDVYSQRKGGSLNRHATVNSLPHQFGYGFSLPWYRTILDVNIDAFEEKPWRHPGVDITDFFNFGFNEDSWKQYCISLEKFRQRSSRQARIPVYCSSTLEHAYEAEAGLETATQDAMTENVGVEQPFKCADRGKVPLELPKGRAIQVEDSINERQPSMDLRRPRFQDSDVIIEITVQDSIVDSSQSAREELGYRGKCEVSDSGKLDVEDNRDACFPFSASGDDLSGEHYARVENVTASSPLRSLQPTIASKKTSLETINHGNDKLSDRNGDHHQNMGEIMETKNKENEVACGNTHHSDPCIIEPEPSLDNRSHFSPTLSFSESYSEERSKDSVHAVSIEGPSPLRRQSLEYGTELQKSVAPYNKSSRIDGQKTKPNDGEGYSIHSSPLRDKKKHERHRHFLKQKISLESDDDSDTSPISDSECDRKRYRRHRYPVEEGRKHHSGRPLGITHRKIYPENSYEASLVSNEQKLCDKVYSTVYCGRQKERPPDLGYHDREDSSLYKEKGPCIKGHKRSADSHIWAVIRARPSFKDDLDEFVGKQVNGKEFYHGRAGIDKEDDKDGFWHREQRLPAQEGLFPRTYRESGRLVSIYSSASERRDIPRRRGYDGLQRRKKIDQNDCPLDYNIEDEWLKEKHGRSIPYLRGERDMGEPYERCLPPIRREFKASGRKGRYVDPAYFHLDGSWPMESEDECLGHTSSRSLALATDREPSVSNRRRQCNTVLSGNKGDDSKLIERYHRHQRILCNEEDIDSGRFSYYDHIDENEDEILQNDNQVQSWRRGHCQQYRAVHSRQDKLLVNDRFYAQEVSFSSQKTSKHDLIHARHESLRDETLINDLTLEHHGYEMITEGSNANCRKRNSIIRYRSQHEQKFLKDRDSVDLIVGEGKSSVKHSDGRSLMCKGRLEKMGSEFRMGQKSLDVNDYCGGTAVKADISNMDGRRYSEKQLDKFSVAECNLDQDIEEGQIICEEQTIKGINLGKENASETTLQRGKVKMRTSYVDNASDGNNAVGEYDNIRILQTLAKMEKRRERFKDPITTKREPDKTSEPQLEPVVGTNDIKHQRPARKRQWGVS